MDSFTHLKQKLAILKKLDPECKKVFGADGHTYALRDPLSEESVQKYEAAHGIRLPEDYRDFLIHMGDGGAGPGYGLYRLSNAGILGILSEPFPYSTSIEAPSDDGKDGHELNYNGSLVILTFGCGYDLLLIVSGPERGNLWFWNYRDLEPVPYSVTDVRRTNLMTWYERWLDLHIEALQKGKTRERHWSFGFFD